MQLPIARGSWNHNYIGAWQCIRLERCVFDAHGSKAWFCLQALLGVVGVSGGGGVDLLLQRRPVLVLWLLSLIDCCYHCPDTPFLWVRPQGLLRVYRIDTVGFA